MRIKIAIVNTLIGVEALSWNGWNFYNLENLNLAKVISYVIKESTHKRLIGLVMELYQLNL